MRRFTIVAFDDTFTLTFSASTTATASVYTPVHIADELASVDQLAGHLIADSYSASGSPSSPKISAQYEVSNDGRNFVNKNGSTPEFTATAVAAATTTSVVGTDSGSTPSLSKVRVRIDLTTGVAYTGTITVHAKLIITGRDQG